MTRFKINKYSYFILCVLLFFTVTKTNAQGGKKAFEVSGSVTDAEGQPIKNAVVYTNEGKNKVVTGEDGSFIIEASEDTYILIEHPDYEDNIVPADFINDTSKIALIPKKPFEGTDREINLIHGVKKESYKQTGAVSQISADKLVKYPDPLLSNTLQGQGLGLISRMAAGGMANNPADLRIRGLHRNNENGIIVVVDGMERDFEDLLPEEIESIEIVKDPSTKILYGARAANGVLQITTKEGKKHTRNMKVSAEYGVGLTTRMPEYLNAYDYATLFNEARVNDGLLPLYSQEDLEGYKNSSGAFDQRYPDADYVNEFLRNYTEYYKVTSELTGGAKGLTYAIVLGYLGNEGLQTVGKDPRNDRFNVRGKLNMDINDFMTAHVGLGTQLEFWKLGGLNHEETFEHIRDHRPNEYPFVLEHENLPELYDELYYGGSRYRNDNIYGELNSESNLSQEYINSQMNMGLNFDFNKYVEGLSAGVGVTFDNYFYTEKRLNKNRPTYEPIWYTLPDGRDTVHYEKLRVGNDDQDYNLTGKKTLQDLSYNAIVNYDKLIGKNDIDIKAGYYYQVSERASLEQDLLNSNAFITAHNTYSRKYMADLTLAWYGSNRFEKGNKYFMSYAFGAGWLLSAESFMQSISTINFLKLKASYGVLGYDASTDFLLYENRWENGDNYKYQEKDQAARTSVGLVNIASPGLNWEKSREINLGMVGLFLNNSVYAEINYFNELRSDIIQKQNAMYSGIYGGYYKHSNYGKVANQGVELEVNYTGSISDVNYTVGMRAMYTKNKLKEFDEINYDAPERAKEGLSSDAIMGYQSAGLFGRDVQIENHAHQTFGPYNNGDIAYVDVYEDGTITDLDKKMIGNNFPRTTLGIDVDLNYKGFGLYVLGTAELGVDRYLNNHYYQMYGIRKYSVMANEAYHAERNPGGTLPRLTTTNAKNNTVDSDFWIEDVSFFRLKNVELSYTLSNFSFISNTKSLKFYLRGTNLFVISKIKELDPEALAGGVDNYPVLRTVLGGVSFTF